jgi:hypothetical protein
MKQILFIIIILAAVGIVFPQSRYLISPSDEVIPLTKAERTAAAELNKRFSSSVQTACSNEVLDGYTTRVFPVTSRFGAYHKDVLGQWYVTRFSGRIDTLFWYMNGSFPSNTFLQINIFRSNVSRTRGPGVSPFPPPCSPWGYYQNTYTNEVSPFKESNDYFWVSTVDGDSLSFPPFGEELWKEGGDTVVPQIGVNQIPISTATESLVVNVGDLFFVTMRVLSGDSIPPPDERTEWAASGFSTHPPYQEYFPSRNWKFYTEPFGPSNCAGHPQNTIPMGWIARGGFTDDTLDVAVFNWWYSISVTSNTPPRYLDSSLVQRFYCDADTFCYSFELEDCNPEHPEEAGFSDVHVEWYVDFTSMGNIPATQGIGNSWSVCIPRVSPCGKISWTVVATDSQGLTVNLPQQTIKFCSMNNEYATIDTSSNCPTLNISGTGNLIPSERFFNHPNNLSPSALDEGTAGPFPLGGTFDFYGQQLRYAWVGVNGAIALSETATETLDVNSAGFFSSFDFPSWIRKSNYPRDSFNPGMPPNFIAPFWNDLVYGDSVSRYGSILWDTTGCNFIVQWDSLAIYDANGDHMQDEFVFRVVINWWDNTIEYQYDNIGVGGADTTALIGFQSDTVSMFRKAPWSFINKNAAPCSPLPHNGSCFHIRQPNSSRASNSWNMFSFPGGDSTRIPLTYIFPNTTSPAFRYEGGTLVPYDTIAAETCYWIKPNGSPTISIVPSFNTDSCDVQLQMDWNLVSSCIAYPISVSTIDDTLVQGQRWFGFNNGYYMTNILLPFECYWVKSKGEGTLLLTSQPSTQPKTNSLTSALSKFNQLTLKDNSNGEQTLYIGNESDLQSPKDVFELPPLPPAGLFDARFSSNNMVETFSNKRNEEFVINVQSSTFPLTFSWDCSFNQTKTFVLSPLGTEKKQQIQLRGKGSVKITDPTVTQLRLQTIEGSSVSLEFALLQNYPNPFNPSTNFVFHIPNIPPSEVGHRGMYVTLKIFDVLGREVTTLVNEEKEPGEYTIEWDASNFPSGVYFYKLTAGKFTDVKKLLLIR